MARAVLEEEAGGKLRSCESRGNDRWRATEKTGVRSSNRGPGVRNGVA